MSLEEMCRLAGRKVDEAFQLTATRSDFCNKVGAKCEPDMPNCYEG